MQFPLRTIAPLLYGLTYFALASLAVGLTRFDGGVAFLWLASSILIAALATVPLRRWWERLIPCALASALATGLFGLGWTLAPPFVAINMCEAIIAAYLLRRSRHRSLPLGSLPWLMQFVAAVGIAGPVVSATLAATTMALAGSSWLHTFITFFTGHALGNITFTPLALLALRGDMKAVDPERSTRDTAERAILITLVIATCIAVFAQSHLPLLFLPILPIILMTFRMGRGGAALAIVVVAVIGGLLTAAGHGPMQLVSGAAGDRLVMFQLYLAATVLTILPVAADLKQRSQLLRDVRVAGERFQLLAEHSTDILMHLSIDGRIRFVSPSIRQLGGYEPAELIGKDCTVMIAPSHLDAVRAAHQVTLEGRGDTHSFEYLATTGDGAQRWFETHARAMLDESGTIDGVLSIIRDISARKANEDRLAQAAMTDALTGLANRRAFRAIIEARHGGDGDVPADCLAVLDIDHFKSINDRFGHDTGDRFLRTFADVARRMLRQSDAIARVGGEEFAILFPNSSIDQAMLVCDRLRAEMAATTLQIGEASASVTISGGVVAIGPDGLDSAFRAADAALYSAKNGGRDQFRLAA